MTTDLQVPEVDIELIDVVEGFNSRKEMDETELAQLAATIEAHGIVQPFSVKPKDDGRFDLTFGHRRLEAAKRAGKKKVPVIPGKGNPRVEAFYENNHHAALNPVERALDTKALAEELGLTTNKAIAAVAGKKPEWVGAHLRLLALPEEVQRYIAEGIVPMEAERTLREVAKVSPPVAACVCELAKRRKVKPSRFVAVFDDLLAEAPSTRFAEKPTMIPVGHVRLKEVVGDAEKRAALTERCNEALAKSGIAPEDDPVIEFGEPEIDAARAAGCLIERRVDQGEWFSFVRLLTDADLAADLCERRVERFEREVDERNMRLEAGAAERAEREKKYRVRTQGVDPDASAEKQAKERKDQRAKAQQQKEEARRYNEELGRNLIERRGGGSRKQHSLTRFRIVARALLEAYPELAGRGLRLVLPQLHEVEVKTLKSGEPREKVSYADVNQAAEYLARQADAAGSVNEGLELLADAFIAAILAEEEALPQSKRTRYRAQPAGWAAELLAAEIKEVRPRRRRKK